MSEADAVAVVLCIGVTLYAVLAGADFGAGFWTLLSGRSSRGRRARELIDWAIGPVWEVNHVWLIFILVTMWAAFSVAFEAIFSTLFIPLTLAALGIVLRGAGFAFHEVATKQRSRMFATEVFAISSILTPFFLGTAVGAIASGRIPPGNAAGDTLTSWLNPLSVIVGVLFVVTGAYLAAVFLVSDARRAGDADLEEYFRRRAIGAAFAAGLVAIGGMFALRADARFVFDGLVGPALPLVIASAIAGLGALLLLARRARRGSRELAVAAVVAIVAGWAVAQHPYLLPTSLTIDAGAGTSATLSWILVVFGVAVLLVIPSLILLFTLVQRGRLEADREPRGSS